MGAPRRYRTGTQPVAVRLPVRTRALLEYVAAVEGLPDTSTMLRRLVTEGLERRGFEVEQVGRWPAPDWTPDMVAAWADPDRMTG